MHLWIEQGGESFALLPERAIWWPEEKTLLVADVHFGKSAEFRMQGIPVPEGDSMESLNRMGALVEAWDADRIIVLGDLFHGAAANQNEVQMLFQEWIKRYVSLSIQLVPGNHDRHAKHLPQNLGIEVTAASHLYRGHHFSHFPSLPNPHASAFAGHLHPAVRLKEDGGPVLRLPCFYRFQSLLILPAFGSFTGNARISPEAESEVWGVVDSRLLSIPVDLCRS